MSITGHFVNGLARQPLAHIGTNQTPQLVVIHYSVTNTVASAVAALNAATLSYHILIEKNGKAFQTRRFTETAAHPGLSNWKSSGGLTMGASVSRGSIGICLMNMGFAFAPGQPHAAGKLIYNPNDPTMQQWETYPAAQLATCQSIVSDIVGNYPITEVVGHHDVAIMGKFDPGPLFDFAPLNVLITTPKPLGFATKVDVPGGHLEVREEPNASSRSLHRLAHGTAIHIRSVVYGSRAQSLNPAAPSMKRYITRWASVGIGNANVHAGFVNMKFLAATPLVPALAALL